MDLDFEMDINGNNKFTFQKSAVGMQILFMMTKENYK